MSTSNLPPQAQPAPAKATRLPARTIVTVIILLLIPCVALGAVPTYSRETPKLWGWPFFYWYQTMWVLITPALTYLAYVLIKRARGGER